MTGGVEADVRGVTAFGTCVSGTVRGVDTGVAGAGGCGAFAGRPGGRLKPLEDFAGACFGLEDSVVWMVAGMFGSCCSGQDDRFVQFFRQLRRVLDPQAGAIAMDAARNCRTYCASYKRPPRAVTLDVDDTLDVVHGHQQLSLFNAHYDERCFLPIHVYDTATSRPVAVLLRTGATPSGVEVRAHLRRMVRRIRSQWPDTRLTIRGDGHYGRPEVMAWCEANGVDYIFGLPGNAVLDRLVEPVADDVRVRRAWTQVAVVRRYCETRYGARSWRCERRVAARIEATTQGLDIRYAVINIPAGSAQWLYDSLYCPRGQAENLIKLHKTQLASDRTSCRSALANQVRLVLHTGAYWLMLKVRDAIPRPQPLAAAEFTTLRMRLIKIAARIVETASRGRVAFAAAHLEAALFASLARCLQPTGFTAGFAGGLLLHDVGFRDALGAQRGDLKTELLVFGRNPCVAPSLAHLSPLRFGTAFQNKRSAPGPLQAECSARFRLRNSGRPPTI
jgi:hypothetical protein